MKKIKKSNPLTIIILALFLVSIVTSPIVQAEENFEQVDLQTIEFENIQEESDEVNEEEAIEPSLIPGDFFYFVKIAIEKIKLAITFDDVKEAELLAKYASERLAEAEALFVIGKEEDALKVIEKAIEFMDSTEDFEKNHDESEAVGNKDVTVIDDSSASEVNNKLEPVQRQNIIALTAALEKVSNPKAMASLQKNIDKTYEKIAKKLEKELGVEEETLEMEAEEHPLNSIEAPKGDTEVESDASIASPISPNAAVVNQPNKNIKQEIPAEKAKEKQAVKGQLKKEEKHQKKAEKHQNQVEKKQVKNENKNNGKNGENQGKAKNENNKNGQ
ncbi:DUF5667 domain-containing protein [Bacillus sp. B15-48]|uniref:DUF5667 domain-containing protein n=1 Tax=Bacillus sp. B15-48 TaxID=1548601 RepID=UPI00193F195F|nr:DUF5667 domain-containing protein [Bacillus sp. B15-48]MBM4764308.1 hypothetical protein [Bacillus sp. B15-48]